MNDKLPYGWEMRALLTRQLPKGFIPDEDILSKCEHEWGEKNYCLYNSLHHRCRKCGDVK
jgi:hypothetical protein